MRDNKKISKVSVSPKWPKHNTAKLLERLQVMLSHSENCD